MYASIMTCIHTFSKIMSASATCFLRQIQFCHIPLYLSKIQYPEITLKVINKNKHIWHDKLTVALPFWNNNTSYILVTSFLVTIREAFSLFTFTERIMYCCGSPLPTCLVYTTCSLGCVCLFSFYWENVTKLQGFEKASEHLTKSMPWST